MTLKEKFNKISCKGCDMEYCDINCTMLSDYELEHLEKVAEDFAVGFGCWIHQNLTHISKDSWGVYNGEWLTVNESLEIYKKEKGL